MSTRLKEKLEKIQQILTDLAEESANGKLVVVEGRKDVETLRAIGLQGPLFTIKTGGKTFAEALNEIEQSSASEIILLLDFDRRGKEATLYFKQNLELAKIKPNLRYWSFLYGMLSREIQCVESLSAYMETLRQKTA